jgi:hypothetical protein
MTAWRHAFRRRPRAERRHPTWNSAGPRVIRRLENAGRFSHRLFRHAQRRASPKPAISAEECTRNAPEPHNIDNVPQSALTNLKPLDVCLLNGRSYVQGTQMIARASEQLAPASANLVGAKFSRLTDRQVFAGVSDESSQAGDCIGSLNFHCPLEQRVILLFEGPQLAPLRQSTAGPKLAALDHDGSLSGTYSFNNAVGLEGIVEALVQGIKLMHEGISLNGQSAQVSDIWFTGMRNFEIPTRSLPSEGYGKIAVRCLRVHAAGTLNQSLLQVRLDTQELPATLQGQVGFAYRTSRGTHVD